MTESKLQNNACFRSEFINSFFLSGCVAFYSGLDSLKQIKELSRLGLFFLFLFNIIYHAYEFALCCSFLVLYIAYSIVRATIYNFIFILGGFLSQNIYYDTGKYNQLAIRSVLFFILNTAAFIKEETSLLIGLFFPHYILNSIKEISKEQRTNNSLYESQYLYYIYSIGKFLKKHNFSKLSIFITKLLSEPLDTIFHSFKILLTGKNKEYHVHGANPKNLTIEQKKHTPILLLHGLGHNQAVFEHLLLAYKNQKPNTPVFTINLLDSDGQEKRQESIAQKINEIKSLYDREVEPQIIGHGAGADEAVTYKNSILNENPSSTTKMYILMGATKYCNSSNDLYFEAEYDEVTTLTATESPIYRKINIKKYESGHLSLLTDPKVVKNILAN